VFVRLCGTLPIYRRQDNPELTYRNEETFRACHELFDEGGAIVIFPEGESETDREVLPLKTGAARLSLGYDSKPGREGRLVVVPVGVYFADRTRFQSDVTLSVGPPIDLSPYREMASADPQGAVRQLTAAMQKSLEALILNVPNHAIAELVRDVERLYLEDLREKRQDAADLELLRRMADCIHYYQEIDPERVYSAWGRMAAYRRKLLALGFDDPTLKERVPPGLAARSAARLAIGGTAGLAPAVAGLAINYLPYRATGLVAGFLVPEAIRVSAGRIVAGALFFPLTYGLAATGLRLAAGWSWPAIAAFVLLGVPLGYFALVYLRWLKKEVQRLRLAILASRRRRLVAKLRAERKELIRMFEVARSEFLEATSNPLRS